MSALDDAWNKVQSTIGPNSAAKLKTALSSELASRLESTFDYIEIRSGFAPPVRFTGKDFASIGAKAVNDALPPRPPPPAPPGQRPPPPSPRSAPSITLASLAKPTIIARGAIFGGERAYYTSAGAAGSEDYKRFWTTAAMLVIAVIGAAFLGGVQYERRRKK